MGAKRIPKIQELPGGKFRIQVKNRQETVDEVFLTMEAAEAYRLARWGDGVTPAPDKLTFGGFVEQVFKRSTDYTRAGASTVAAYSSRLTHLVRYFGTTRLADIDPGAVMDYAAARASQVSERTKKLPADETLRLELSVLSVILAQAVTRRLLPHNPVLDVKRPPPTRRTRRVPAGEQRALTDTADDVEQRKAMRQAARFLIVQGELGCRVSELAELTIDCLELDSGWLKGLKTKRGTDKQKRLSPRAAKLLRVQRATFPLNARFVFESRTKKGVPRAYNYKHGLVILRAAEVLRPGFHTHANRREYISNAIEAGTPYDDIARQTDHSSVAAVEIYNQAAAWAPARVERIDALHASRYADLEEASLIASLESDQAAADAADPEVATIDAQIRALRRRRATLIAGGNSLDLTDEDCPAPLIQQR